MVNKNSKGLEVLMNRKCVMKAECSEAWNDYFLAIKSLEASRELILTNLSKAELLQVDSLLQSNLKSTCVFSYPNFSMNHSINTRIWIGSLESYVFCQVGCIGVFMGQLLN